MKDTNMQNTRYIVVIEGNFANNDSDHPGTLQQLQRRLQRNQIHIDLPQGRTNDRTGNKGVREVLRKTRGE
jgi:glycerol-3-phosphate responsive antiterminator